MMPTTGVDGDDIVVVIIRWCYVSLLRLLQGSGMG